MCNTNNELDQELHYLDLLRSYQVEGIVVNAVGMREDGLNRLQQSALPMVLIDRKIPTSPAMWSGLITPRPPPPPPNIWWKRIRGHPVSQRTAGLGEYPSRAPERLRATLARHHGVVAENAEVQLTTARCWTTSCVSSMPATAGCVKRSSPPTAR